MFETVGVASGTGGAIGGGTGGVPGRSLRSADPDWNLSSSTGFVVIVETFQRVSVRAVLKTERMSITGHAHMRLSVTIGEPEPVIRTAVSSSSNLIK